MIKIFIQALFFFSSFWLIKSSESPSILQLDDCEIEEILNDLIAQDPISISETVPNCSSSSGSASNNLVHFHENIFDDSDCEEPASLEENANLLEKKRILLRDLEAKCRGHNPSLVFENFDLRDFEIENWPGFTKKSSFWSPEMIQNIRDKIDYLRFRWRERIYNIAKDPEAYFGSKASDYGSAHSIIMKRFREETGQYDAKHIDWHFFYKHHIPPPFNVGNINIYNIRTKEIFVNNAIMNNIHFWKYAEEDKTDQGNGVHKIPRFYHKNKRHVISQFIASQFLKIFQKQTGFEPCSIINWKRLIKEALPEKYRGIEKIDLERIWNDKLYLDSDFVDNIQFRKYTKRDISKKKFHLKCKYSIEEPLQLSGEELIINGVLLNRFRVQSGDLCAEEINWDHIDYKVIPEDCKTCKIDEKCFFKEQMYLNRELMELLRFEPYEEWEMNILKRVYKVTDDHEAVDVTQEMLKRVYKVIDNNEAVEGTQEIAKRVYKVMENHETVKETREIVSNERQESQESTLHSRKRKKKDMQDVDAATQKPIRSSYPPVHNYAKGRTEAIEKYREQTGKRYANYVNWNHLIKDDLPERYKNKKIVGEVFFKEKLYEDPEFMNNLKFPRLTDKENHETVKDTQEIVSNERRESQESTLHSRKRKKKDMQDVDAATQKSIRSSFPCVQKQAKGRTEAIEKYREQTGKLYAAYVNWNHLIRDDLPERYKYKKIDGEAFFKEKLYEDPEFMKNLKFPRLTDKYQ